jgi:hypothetical protein
MYWRSITAARKTRRTLYAWGHHSPLTDEYGEAIKTEDGVSIWV